MEMKMKITILMLGLTAASVYGFERDMKISDLPKEIATQFIQLALNRTEISPVPIGDCKNPKPSDIKLKLYTRKSAKTPTVLNLQNPIEIDPSKKVIVLIHGWIASATAYGFPELKDAYLQRYDCNLIIVDWSKLALDLYHHSVCYLPKIGKMVADFLCQVSENKNIPLSSVHLVGHSLGGQMSGFIGQSTQATCSQNIGRITGLDPAGPLFQGVPKTGHLDKSDASFVDIMHTNGGVFGYWNHCGHVDFYVNCGMVQLGCPVISLDPRDIANLPISVVACNHLRALDYMAESVNSQSFKGKVCHTCPEVCLPNLLAGSSTVMGEDCPENVTGGKVLVTGLRPPYGLN